jgi:hypothetical protein
VLNPRLRLAICRPGLKSGPPLTFHTPPVITSIRSCHTHSSKMAFALSSKSALRTAARTTGAKVRPKPGRLVGFGAVVYYATARSEHAEAHKLCTCVVDPFLRPALQSSRVVPRAAVEWYGPDRPKYLGASSRGSGGRWMGGQVLGLKIPVEISLRQLRRSHLMKAALCRDISAALARNRCFFSRQLCCGAGIVPVNQHPCTHTPLPRGLLRWRHSRLPDWRVPR